MKRTRLLRIVFFVSCAIAALIGQSAYGQGDVRDLVESLELGEPVCHGNLTIIPITTAGAKTAGAKGSTPFFTLDEAMQKNWLEITEIEGGQVPSVRLRNISENFIYIMGGEVLSGCRQDRIVGRDVLIRPRGKNIVVPVYCVEEGRWSYTSERFTTKQNLGTWNLRAEAQKNEEAAQSEIWEQVSKLSEKNRVRSGTGAYQAIYDEEKVKDRISALERAMKGVPSLSGGTIGFVCGVGDRVVSVDVFADPGLFARLWPKLLRSSALAAISTEAKGGMAKETALAFIRMLREKRFARNPAIDQGIEMQAVDGEINANALVFREAVIHLAAFPQNAETGGTEQAGDGAGRIQVQRRE